MAGSVLMSSQIKKIFSSTKEPSLPDTKEEPKKTLPLIDSDDDEEETSPQISRSESPVKKKKTAKKSRKKEKHPPNQPKIPLKTYDLVTSDARDIPKRIFLGKLYEFHRLGQLNIDDTISIGDTDYTILSKDRTTRRNSTHPYRGHRLKTGIFHCLQVNDNLMLLHDDAVEHLKDTSDIGEWNWKYTGVGVGVDSGTFGFYNTTTLEKIVDPEKNWAQNLPRLNFPNKKGQTLISFMVNATMLQDSPEQPIDSKENFGVIAHTFKKGPSGFHCYTAGSDRVLLVGGQSMKNIKNNWETDYDTVKEFSEDEASSDEKLDPEKIYQEKIAEIKREAAEKAKPKPQPKVEFEGFSSDEETDEELKIRRLQKKAEKLRTQVPAQLARKSTAPGLTTKSKASTILGIREDEIQETLRRYHQYDDIAFNYY